MATVLALGLDPHFADLTSMPNLTPELVRAFVDSQLERMRALGYEVESCLVDSGQTAEAVLADSLRKNLLELGLIRPTQLKLPVTRISLTIRGIRTYGDYVKCRTILQDQIPGIREIVLREASWSLARFDLGAEGTVPTLAERLREKLAVEIQYQDDRVLEVHLR